MENKTYRVNISIRGSDSTTFTRVICIQATDEDSPYDVAVVAARKMPRGNDSWYGRYENETERSKKRT